MSSKRLLSFAPVVCLAVTAAGCSEFIRQDRAPVTLVIDTFQASRGEETTLSSSLSSDVITVVDDVPTIFPDRGVVNMRLVMKDVLAAPSPVNSVTITRYQVVYRRSDGRNTPGVDVPYPFSSGLTVTVPSNGAATASFELVRVVAKQEAPLRPLLNSALVISTIAEVTFFGRDQAGNELSVVGTIGVHFGNYGDPE